VTALPSMADGAEAPRAGLWLSRVPCVLFPRSPSGPWQLGGKLPVTSPRRREQLQLRDGSSPHPAKGDRGRWGRRLGPPTSAQTGQQTRQRAGVRRGSKANLQGSRGSEIKLPPSSPGTTERQGRFARRASAWPRQASAGPRCPPRSSDPAEGDLSLRIIAFERKRNFLQRKYLLLISVNRRENGGPPPPLRKPNMRAAYFNSSCHIRGSSERGAGCWHMPGFACCPPQEHQHPSGQGNPQPGDPPSRLHLLPFPRPPAPFWPGDPQLGFKCCPPQDSQLGFTHHPLRDHQHPSGHATCTAPTALTLAPRGRSERSQD